MSNYRDYVTSEKNSFSENSSPAIPNNGWLLTNTKILIVSHNDAALSINYKLVLLVAVFEILVCGLKVLICGILGRWDLRWLKNIYLKFTK